MALLIGSRPIPFYRSIRTLLSLAPFDYQLLAKLTKTPTGHTLIPLCPNYYSPESAAFHGVQMSARMLDLTAPCSSCGRCRDLAQYFDSVHSGSVDHPCVQEWISQGSCRTKMGKDSRCGTARHSPSISDKTCSDDHPGFGTEIRSAALHNACTDS